MVYEIFSKRIIKTIFSLEDRGTCRVRLIMEVSPALLGKLAKESRRSFEREGQGKGKEDITVFLVHHEELGKLNGILNRCSIFWE